MWSRSSAVFHHGCSHTQKCVFWGFFVFFFLLHETQELTWPQPTGHVGRVHTSSEHPHSWSFVAVALQGKLPLTTGFLNQVKEEDFSGIADSTQLNCNSTQPHPASRPALSKASSTAAPTLGVIPMPPPHLKSLFQHPYFLQDSEIELQVAPHWTFSSKRFCTITQLQLPHSLPGVHRKLVAFQGDTGSSGTAEGNSAVTK